MTTPADQPADLLAFIRSQLDEDERVARAVPEAPWGGRSDSTGYPDIISVPRDQQHGRDEIVLSDVWRDGIVDYATRFDPARVLAEVDAKRRILDEYDKALNRRRQWPGDLSSAGALLTMVHVVKLLALPFAGHPDYREEWRP